MFGYYIYFLISIIAHPFLKIFLRLRLIKKKEDPSRYLEKLAITKKKSKEKIIWFHLSSLGELKSIIPILKHFEKNQKLILVTTSTLSAGYFLTNKFKSSKIIHQYSPLDSPFIVKRFLDYWKPRVAIFVESELWPNLIFHTSKKCKMILLNCRISKKSFKRWKILSSFVKKILDSFEIILPQSKETESYLNYFKIKNKIYIGNIKLSNLSNKTSETKLNINTFNWIAMSVHPGEINYIIRAHLFLKNKLNKLTTIIVPRHINKIDQFDKSLKNNSLEYSKLSLIQKKSKLKEIILIDKYGEADNLFQLTNCVFVGGSLIKHGGQNPLEPASKNCSIIHGPNIQNFSEIYELLKKKGVSFKINDQNELNQAVEKEIRRTTKKENSFLIDKGKSILEKTIFLLNKYID